MKRIIALLLVCIGMALPYLKSMEVVPTRADWSGWTARDGWVGNTLTANFDSICYCDVFIGHVGDTSHHYRVDVLISAINSFHFSKSMIGSTYANERRAFIAGGGSRGSPAEGSQCRSKWDAAC